MTVPFPAVVRLASSVMMASTASASSRFSLESVGYRRAVASGMIQRSPSKSSNRSVVTFCS